MKTFSELLNKPTVFLDRNVLSPHFVPETLPFREKEIERIMAAIAPALNNQRPQNMFIYGKTGTGKTCSVKHVLAKFSEFKSSAKHVYMNCRMYNSRYRVIQKIAKELFPDLDTMGFGLAILYEKIIGEVAKGMRLIVVLDEVDMVKELDDLLYTLTRANDELPAGSISILGITNKVNFKEKLGSRSKSSLCENEMVFPPYTAFQLQSIIRQRAAMGFKEGVVDESAVNLAAALTANDSGDARYALKLLLKAGEIADEQGAFRITDREVEEARRSVDTDIAFEAISTLPEHQQLVLLAIASLTLDKGKNTRLTDGLPEDEDAYLTSGEVYEGYCAVARRHRKPRRSTRWYREYLNDLEMLGLITTIESGAGMRGRTRLIRMGYPPADVKKIIERNFSIIEGVG